jgi:hypothetical protein
MRMKMSERDESPELSEREWFSNPHTLEELEAQYQDPATNKYRREHAFTGYWRKLVEQKGKLSQSELERLLEHPEWIHPIGDIIESLASRDAIDQEELRWLLDALPMDSYAHEQLTVLSLLRDSTVSWEDKLRRALDSRVEWARQRVVETLPIDETERARELIARSRCGKGTRNHLLWILYQRGEAAR